MAETQPQHVIAYLDAETGRVDYKTQFDLLVTSRVLAAALNDCLKRLADGEITKPAPRQPRPPHQPRRPGLFLADGSPAPRPKDDIPPEDLAPPSEN